MSQSTSIEKSLAARYAGDDLAAFCRSVFAAIDADDQSATAATAAMMHASRLGIDSHGVRLLPHYVAAMLGGRVNRRPEIRFPSVLGAVATLDADNGHGALAAFRAMDKALEIAREARLGAVAIRNSSHFGAAGVYALHAAEQGMIGFAFCNSDSFVRLHGGAERFHGTNPIACAVPSGTGRPWLLDMATSAIPYNRIGLYRSLGIDLPDGVASDANGADTRHATAADMLAPLGGAFGFKGAGLAGMVEILSAVVTGMRLSFDILPMNGEDLSTPRGLGAFVLAMRPDAFVERQIFEEGMERYVARLRNSQVAAGQKVMAPGDREWAEEAVRLAHGVPVDPETEAAFHALAERHGIAMPSPLSAGPDDVGE